MSIGVVLPITVLMHVDCVHPGSSKSTGEGDARQDQAAGLGCGSSDPGCHTTHTRVPGNILQSATGEDQRNHQCTDPESALQTAKW